MNRNSLRKRRRVRWSQKTRFNVFLLCCWIFAIEAFTRAFQPVVPCCAISCEHHVAVLHTFKTRTAMVRFASEDKMIWLAGIAWRVSYSSPLQKQSLRQLSNQLNLFCNSLYLMFQDTLAQPNSGSGLARWWNFDEICHNWAQTLVPIQLWTKYINFKVWPMQSS